MRVEFRLSMPNVGSWNGKWSGSQKNYVRYRNLTKKQIEFLDFPNKKYWHYSWSDGWSAGVTLRAMDVGERKKKSDGFCGYDWMIDEIIKNNKITKGEH